MTPSDSAPQSSIGVEEENTIFNLMPPQGLVLLAIIAIQVGSGIAVQLFPILGIEGTVAVRIVFSAIILGMTAKAKLYSLWQIFLANWAILCLFGICMVAMNFFFYKALFRIPLGAVVAIEFVGPLSLAAITSKRLIHFLWVALAAVGILLLSPLSGANLDTWGIIFALIAGAGWTTFIILGKRVGKKVSGNSGLTIAMFIAAIFMIPFFVPVVPILIQNPYVLFIGLCVALLATSIPFTLEFQALKKLSHSAYGILISLEPAVAALVGVIVLKEQITMQGIIAVICVVVAAIGITLSEKKEAEN
ncbi:MAG: DMT family transporter [Saprospiraceae bacterium]